VLTNFVLKLFKRNLAGLELFQACMFGLFRQHLARKKLAKG